MYFVRLLTVALGVLVLSSFGVAAEEELWTTNFDAAKAKAKAESKLLLVDFTGSDWCGWCIRLKKEVFDEKAFQAEAPKQFVLVELDYPQAKKLPEELAEQNKKLAKEYKVHGFPTILIMDAEGKKVAKTGYRPGGPEAYLKHLAETVKTYQTTVDIQAKLEKAQGLDRAKLLDELVDAYEKLQNDSAEVIGFSKQIVALDADNKAGLKAKHEVRMYLAEAAQAMQEEKFDEAMAAFQKAVAVEGITAEQKQNAYFSQGECFFRKKDFGGTVDCLKKALEAAPDGKSAGQIKAMLERFSGLADAQAVIAKSKPELEKAQGLERAAILDRLIDAYEKLNQTGPSDITPDQIDKWAQEIVQLDAENKAGLKGKYEFSIQLEAARKQHQEGKTADALATVDKALALSGLKAEQTQEGLMLKAGIHAMSREFPKALECLNKALEAAPKSQAVPTIKAMTERVQSEIEKK